VADANIGANIGERMAALEARFDGFQLRFDNFQVQMATNQGAIMEKLNKIESSFEARREKVNDRIVAIEARAPAIIQQIVLGVSMGIVIAIISYVAGRVP